MAEVELSRSLGIVLPANNDIIWVARRALAAKPGGRLKSRTHFFKRLVVQPTSEPAWPGGRRRRRPGRRRPRVDPGLNGARHALAANETELSCAKGEPLLVDGGDPGSDGWVVAGRFPDAAETGLVPDSYLRKHEFRVAARDGYEAIGDGELSFEAGETLVIRAGCLPSRSWWLARARGRRGYAPRHILDDEWRQAARNVAAMVSGGATAGGSACGGGGGGSSGGGGRAAGPATRAAAAAAGYASPPPVPVLSADVAATVAELGLPIDAAPDLLWVAHRAMGAKVPAGASATSYYRALAGRLLVAGVARGGGGGRRAGARRVVARDCARSLRLSERE